MNRILLSFLMLISMHVSAQVSMNMDSLFNWQDPNLIPSSAHHNTYNEIWGYAKAGKEYAIIGSTAGTHIFDVTEPANSAQVGFIAGAVTGSQVVHRDFHDHNDYLYMVCDEGPSTLQIADLRFLPDSAPVVYDSNALFPRSHNIFIDTSSARMYVCGGTVQYAVYSLADPTNPALLVNCPSELPFWTSIGYVHDTYVRGDTAYINAGERGLFVVDFSDLNNITMLGSLDVYPQSGYNHSGWLMADQPYYALADETHGKDIKILNVADLSDIEVTDTISSNVDVNSIPHNLIYRDNILYVSYYFDGVYAFNCEDPAHPVLAGFYDTSTEVHQNGVYRGCWGVYPLLPSGNILASDMQTGLWILRPSFPSGIEDVSAERKINVYPNPTDGQLFLPAECVGMSFQILDLSGRSVQRGTVVSSLVDVSALPSGSYLIRLLNDEISHTVRFIRK